MLQPDDLPGKEPANWLEELHRSIASNTGYQPALTDTPGTEEFDQLDECLRLLERVRRGWQEDSSTIKRFGRFEIIREVGRGGFGVVFLAIDPRVGRQVALKIPRAETVVDAGLRRRFMREARAAGVLAHPNLIPVHEVGEDGPICYIASAYCRGPTVAQWLSERNRPVGEREAAATIEALSLGVAHAHSRGVLHRDIKPSNVLLEPLSESPSTEAQQSLFEFTPRLTDFGLAKLQAAGDGETCSGEWLGTPAYMAPEQAEGRWDHVTEATDVYALGVMLFELLAGTPPLRGDTNVQTLQLIARGDMPPLKRLRRDVSRDLDAIVTKCLERDPANRYASAQLLADDLRRFRSFEPTLARPRSSYEELVHWAKRRPAVAGLCAVVMAAVLLLGTGGWWYSRQLSRALNQVELHEQHVTQLLYAQSINLASDALERNQLNHALHQLSQWLPKDGEQDRRDFAWHHLWQKIHSEQLTLVGHSGEVHTVRYSPDGLLVATASQDRTIRLWDAQDGKCLNVLTGHVSEVNGIAFSSQGDYLASASDDGTVRVWDVKTGTLECAFEAHDGVVFGVDFLNNDEEIVTCGEDHKVLLWNWRQGELVDEFVGHTETVGALSVSRTGQWLATASTDHTVRVWDVAQRTVRHVLPHLGVVSSVSFSDDERQILSADRRGIVRLWEMESGEQFKEVSRHHDPVEVLSWDTVGSAYAVGTKSGAVQFHYPLGDLIFRLPGHADRVWSVAFSNDKRHLATASADHTVKIWDLQSVETGLSHDNSKSSRGLAIARSRPIMVAGTSEGTFAVYDLASRKRLWSVERDYDVLGDFDGDGKRDEGHFHDGTWYLRYSGDRVGNGNEIPERLIQFGDKDGIPLVGDWNGDGRDNFGSFVPATGRYSYDLDGQGGKAEDTGRLRPFGALDTRLVPIVGHWNRDQRDSLGVARYTLGSQWTVSFRRPKGLVTARVLEAQENWTPIAGRWLAPAADQWGFCRAGSVWRASLPTGAKIQDPKTKELTYEEPIKAVHVAPEELPLDAQMLAVARDRASWQASYQAIGNLAISPDGRTVAVSHNAYSRVKLWDVETGRRLAVLHGPGEVTGIAYSPNGRTLAVGYQDGKVTLFDTLTLVQTHQWEAHRQLSHLEFAASGDFLVTAGDHRVIKIWNTDRCLRTLTEQGRFEVQCLAVSTDGRQIAVGGSDHLLGLWDVQTGEKTITLAGHDGVVTGADFSPDGRTLATCGNDGAVWLWDVTTGKPLYTIENQLGALSAVQFSGDGQTLVACGDKAARNDQMRSIRVWSAAPVTAPPTTAAAR